MIDRYDLRNHRRAMAYEAFRISVKLEPYELESDLFQEALGLYDQLMQGRWPSVVAGLKEATDHCNPELEAQEREDLVDLIEYIEEIETYAEQEGVNNN